MPKREQDWFGGEDAMGRIRNRLKSERGASITWALLIFMVCAVVGSAVLVAGTASAGRISKLAKNEQRYYSVTSAVGLLRDVLEGDITTTRTDDASDPIVYDPYDDKVKMVIVNEMMDWIGSNQSFWEKDDIAIENPLEISLGITGNGNEISSVVSGTTGSITLYPDGSIIADISKDGFAMRLSFDLERSFTPDPDSKTDTFRWVLREARTVESKDK